MGDQAEDPDCITPMPEPVVIPVPVPSSPVVPAALASQFDIESTLPRKRSKFRLGASVLGICLSLLLYALDSTIISTCLPTIAEDLGTNSAFTWVGAVYWLGCAAATPLWSNWSDIWGRKPMMMAALALFLLSSILCAMATNLIMLLAGRVFQGIGGGGVSVLVFILISDLFSMRTRSMVFGLTEVVWAAASGMGPVLGGNIAQHLSWRWVFWINLPIAGLALVLILIFLDVHNPRTPTRDGLKAIDWFGGLSIIGLAVMLLLGLDFGGELFPWNSPTVICLLAFGVLMCAFFVFSEKRLAAYPILPLGIFKDRSNVACLVAVTGPAIVRLIVKCNFVLPTIFQAVTLIEFYLPIYFQSVLSATPSRSGILLIPFEIAQSCAAFAVGVILHRTGRYIEVIWVAAILMTVGCSLFIAFGVQTMLAQLVVYQIVAAIGIGGLYQPHVIAVQARVAHRDCAASTAALGFAGNLAAAFGVVLGGVVLQNGMQQRALTLEAAGLSMSLTQALINGDAVGSISSITALEDTTVRSAVQTVFAQSVQNIWILGTVAAAVSLLTTVFMRKAVMSREHEETKTGLREIGGTAQS